MSCGSAHKSVSTSFPQEAMASKAPKN